LAPRPVFIDAYKSIEFRIPPVDLIEVRFEQIDCRNASVTNPGSHLPR
jgi:hypothetical protein